jgi:hypothetical protein
MGLLKHCWTLLFLINNHLKKSWQCQTIVRPPCCLSMNATSRHTIKGEAKLLKKVRIVQLCMVMILGRVENKWTFSNLWFMKKKVLIVFTHMLTWLEGCMVKSFTQRRPFHSSWQYVSGLYIKWNMGWQIYPIVLIW